MSGTLDKAWQEQRATDGGDLTHNITTANDKTETQVFEESENDTYQLAVMFDFDTLETSGEGGTVTLRMYNKVDGSNYPDIPNVILQYVIGSEVEYPSLYARSVHGDCKVTIQCSTDVTDTRIVSYRKVKRLV